MEEWYRLEAVRAEAEAAAAEEREREAIIALEMRALQDLEEADAGAEEDPEAASDVTGGAEKTEQSAQRPRPQSTADLEVQLLMADLLDKVDPMPVVRALLDAAIRDIEDADVAVREVMAGMLVELEEEEESPTRGIFYF